MEAYIYCADVYCESCGAKICDELSAKGEAPDDPKDESSFDSGEYPKGPYADGGGEADCPQHCGECHIALDNPLTREGVKYVIDAISHMPRSNVLDSWAEDVAEYSLSEAQESIVETYWAQPAPLID